MCVCPEVTMSVEHPEGLSLTRVRWGCQVTKEVKALMPLLSAGEPPGGQGHWWAFSSMQGLKLEHELWMGWGGVCSRCVCVGLGDCCDLVGQLPLWASLRVESVWVTVGERR